MKKTPSGLLNKIYEFWKPHIDQNEIQFYRKLIQGASGSALELSCGSGRLLLPFLREGFPIEGVESSKELIDILQAKAQEEKLHPVVYHQKIESVELKKIYQLLFITLGSFQLIAHRSDAEIALNSYYHLLDEGGKLVVALFLPWVENQLDTDGWRVVTNLRVPHRTTSIVRREQSIHDPVEQVVHSKVRMELWDGRDLLEFAERDLQLRWYSKGEFTDMLYKAGFKRVEMFRSYSEEAPQEKAFMLFIAEK